MEQLYTLVTLAKLLRATNAEIKIIQQEIAMLVIPGTKLSIYDLKTDLTRSPLRTMKRTTLPSQIQPRSPDRDRGVWLQKLPEGASSASYDDAQGPTAVSAVPSETSSTPTQENHIDAPVSNKETPDNKIISEIHTQENSPFRNNNKRPTPTDKNVSTPTMILDDNREK